MAGWQFWRRARAQESTTLSEAIKPEDAFWRWFEANEARLYDFEQDQAKVFRELLPRIRAVHKNLVFAFGSKQGDKREFVVSAEGIREAFPAVATLVKAAPPLERWRVTAFRPRIGPIDLRFRKVDISPDEIFFVAKPRQTKVDLALFVPDRVFGKGDLHKALCFLMLDNVLGEFDVATKLGAIDVHPRSRAGDALLSPITDLPQVVDGLETVN